MGTERRKLLRGLRIWVDVILLVTLISGVLTVVLWPVAGVMDDGGFDFTVPVVLGNRSFLPVYPLEVDPEALEAAVGGKVPFHLVNTTGELRFQASWLQPAPVYWAFLLLAFGAGVFGLLLLRRILGTAAEGHPFHPANSRRLNLLGWLLVVVGLAGPLMKFFFSRWVLGRLAPLTDTPLSPPLELHEEWLICGFLLLILAGVWKQAALLAEDQSLTV